MRLFKNTKEGREAYRKSMIPEGAVRDPRSSEAAEAYTYERNGKPLAITFWGSAGKPNSHYSYRSAESREEAVARFFEGVKSHTNYKKERADKRKAFKHTLKVGDIVHTSWGYDQTNVDFFEVVRLVSAKTVAIRAIGAKSEATSHDSARVTAIPGVYYGEELIKLVGEGNAVINAKYTYNAYPGGGPTHSSWGH